MLGAVKRSLLGHLPRAWSSRLRAWRVRRLIDSFPARVVEHSYAGCRLRVLLADPLSEGWYDHDWAVMPEVVELRQTRLRPGARVFDIGAHQGVVAAILAHEVGPTGQVIAVEASPHNAQAAVRNCELNGLDQIQVVCAAIADRSRKVLFNEGLNGQIDDGSGPAGRLALDAVTLDGLAERFGPPDVVFLDVEGAEGLALAGGRQVLASGAEFFVEVHVNCGLEKLGSSVADLLNYFPDSDFHLLARAEVDGSFRSLEQSDPLTQDRFFLIARRRLTPDQASKSR